VFFAQPATLRESAMQNLVVTGVLLDRSTDLPRWLGWLRAAAGLA